MDADVVISQPFWPAYLTADRIAKAPNLRLAITAGIGSDHVDLQAAIARNITVCEVTYCNSISVAEHAVMQILAPVRDYIPQYQLVVNGGWNIADAVSRSYDIEGMSVGVVGSGRIGLAVLKRMKPFDVALHYTDRHRLPTQVEEELGLTLHSDVASLVTVCDVVSIHCPLHPETEHLFNDELIGKMKRGSYIVNTARGKICEQNAIVRALETGQLAGYAGDVWFPQPPPKDHPWRTMANHAMTSHTSGTSLPAQLVTLLEFGRSWSVGLMVGQSGTTTLSSRVAILLVRVRIPTVKEIPPAVQTKPPDSRTNGKDSFLAAAPCTRVAPASWLYPLCDFGTCSSGSIAPNPTV